MAIKKDKCRKMKYRGDLNKNKVCKSINYYILNINFMTIDFLF